MVSKHATSRTSFFPTSVRKALSTVAFLIAATLFSFTFALLRQGHPDDSLFAVGTTVLGGAFLIASVSGLRPSCQHENSPANKFANRLPNAVMRLISFALGAIALLGCSFVLFDIVLILNNDYLHWFDSNRSISGGNGLLFELLTMVVVVGSLGAFLIWYALRQLGIWNRLRKLLNLHRSGFESESDNGQENPEDL